MEIKDLKVGQQFLEWRLGYEPNSEGLPERLKPFYALHTIEKVNKVTFVADGEKMKEVPYYWNAFDGSFIRFNNFVIKRAAKYIAESRCSNVRMSNYYVNDYGKFIRTLTEEEKFIFDNLFKKEVESLAEKIAEDYKIRCYKLLEDLINNRRG